jgi:hypothetical protein
MLTSATPFLFQRDLPAFIYTFQVCWQVFFYGEGCGQFVSITGCTSCGMYQSRYIRILLSMITYPSFDWIERDIPLYPHVKKRGINVGFPRSFLSHSHQASLHRSMDCLPSISYPAFCVYLCNCRWSLMVCQVCPVSYALCGSTRCNCSTAKSNTR